MVNVVGRSRGCVTCRQRRVKCDEDRPACRRCLYAKKECAGYDHPIIFKNQGLDIQETPLETAKVDPHSSWQVITEFQDSSDTDSQALVKRTRSPSTSLSQTLDLTAFEEIIVISHLMFKFPLGSGTTNSPPSILPWLSIDRPDLDLECTPYLCARALAEAFFGRIHHQQRMIAKGSALYGQALQSLRADLQDPEKARGQLALMSMMYLGAYERVAFTSELGLFQHAGAMAKLIESRGPYQFQSSPNKELFEANRDVIAVQALMQRKHCFLEHDSWKTLPWALHPASKTLAHHLVDTLCDIPGLIEDATALHLFSASGGDITNPFRELCRRADARLAELYQWRWKWEAAFPNSCYEVETHLAGLGGSTPSPFRTAIYFQELGLAVIINSYNAMQLILLRLQEGLGRSRTAAETPAAETEEPTTYPSPIPEPGHLETPLLLPGQATCQEDIAREICRIVEYHMLGVQEQAGAWYLFFPIRTAYHIFTPTAKEAVWLRQVMRLISERNGFDMGRHLIEAVPIRGHLEGVEDSAPGEYFGLRRFTGD